MIIKGLNKRLAEIGKIKIGCKGTTITSKNGKEFQPPKKYGHFVVTTTEKDSTGNFVIDKEIMQLLGDKPKEIAIRLPFDSIDLNFFTSFQLYQGHKCICRGNGEKAIRIYDNGVSKEIDCLNEQCEYLQKGNCKVSGVLSCYLACKLELGGVYRFRTHGWNSVSNIQSALEDFAYQTGGILLGMPLKLKMLKKSTEKHGNVDTVTVVLDNKIVTEIIEFRQLALKEKESRQLLNFDVKQIENKAKEAGFTKDTDDPADVQDEFYVSQNSDTIQGDAEEIEPDIITMQDNETNPEQHEPTSKQRLNITAKNIWNPYMNKLKTSKEGTGNTYPEKSKNELAAHIREAIESKDIHALEPYIAILNDELIRQGYSE